ncbi:MAG: hypothetical protein WC366_04865 [Bacilli bacterium]
MKDYKQSFAVLSSNFFKFKSYRRMHPVLAIFCGIFMIPFALVGLMSLGFLYVYYYFFKLLLLPAEYLMSFIRFEGKEVKHATQAVIYFVGFPTVFMYYSLIAFEIIGIHIMYLITFVYLYLASLCGFKFRPILRQVDEDIEIEQGPKYNIAIPVVFISVLATLLSLFIVSIVLLDPILLYQIKDPVTHVVTNVTLSIHYYIYLIAPLFYAIYIPLTFGRPIKKVQPPVELKPAESVAPQQ